MMDGMPSDTQTCFSITGFEGAFCISYRCDDGVGWPAD